MISEQRKLNNPILITGASGGIGFAVLQILLDNGHDVIALGRNSNIKKTINEKTLLVEADLTNHVQTKEQISRLIEIHGPFGGFIHCAGFDKLSPLYLNKMSDLESLFDIHVFTSISIVSLLSKKGYLADNSSIVLISSLSAHIGASGHTMYAAAKGAIEGFIPSAASELAHRKIRINGIVPGVVKTKMSNGFISKLNESQVNELNKSYPLGLGEPNNIADLIFFLLSKKSSWITGQRFTIDGGFSIRNV